MTFEEKCKRYTALRILKDPRVAAFVATHSEDRLFTVFVRAHTALVEGYLEGQRIGRAMQAQAPLN